MALFRTLPPTVAAGDSHRASTSRRRASLFSPAKARASSVCGAGEGFAGMGGMMEQIKAAQKFAQTEAVKVQAELAAAEFDGYCKGELVRAVVSGNQEPRSVDVTEAAWELGAERVSELVLEAYKDAHAKSVAAMKSRMVLMAKQMGLPPGMGPA